jgi:lauroyl/myristoyl acyltransferase
MNLSPTAWIQILDRMDVIGLDHLAGLEQDQGLVLVSLHYSLYSSLLVLWLARATVRGLFNHLTMLVVSNPAGALRPSERRLSQLAEAGIWDLARTILLDRRLIGASGATRQLVRRIRDGGAVLILPDAAILPAGEKGLTVRVGHQTVGMPPGLAWLCRTTGTPLASVYVRPHADDQHAIEFGIPAYPGIIKNSDAVVRDVFVALVEQAISDDPTPWEGWLRDGLLPAG